MRSLFPTVACMMCSMMVTPTQMVAQTVSGASDAARVELTQPTPRQSTVANLRRLPANLNGFRFEGEWSESQWPVYLTQAQAREPARFHLASLSAISVMPEGSQLTLIINDTIVGRTPTTRPDTMGARTFDVPIGLLKPGFNAVRIVVEQRHRVDCSSAATYELWTTLNPEKTGLELGGGSAWRGFETSADLAAVPPGPDGSASISIMVTGRLSAETASRAMRAAQLAALSIGTIRPLVEFSTSMDTSSLALVIGTIDELKTTLDVAELGAINGPRLKFMPGRFGRPPVFVVTGTSAADLDAALTAWATAQANGGLSGSDAGQRSASQLGGFRASGEPETQTFRQVGFSSVAFSGHLLRAGFNISMPWDFLSADYGRLALDLAGSQGAMLGTAARLRVDVNGRNAATQGLASGVAGSLEGHQIFLPLSLLRPGSNRIEIVAETPTASDGRCLANRLGTESRIELLDRSEITVPGLARVANAPDLSLTAAGGYPFAQAHTDPVLYVPNPDPATMAAAATLVAQLAVAARRPIPFAVTTTPPARDAMDVLIVSPAPTLDPADLRKAGLAPEHIRRAWQDVALTQGSETRRCGPTDASAEGLPRQDINVDSGTPVLMRLGLKVIAAGRRLLFPRDGSQANMASMADAISGNALILVGQDISAEASPRSWTIVTAASAASLKAGVECLTRPQNWGRLTGGVSSLSADESVLSVPSGDRRRFVATQPLSLHNARLVAAGWLSLHPLTYVGLVLALAGLMASLVLWLVRNIGRRQP